MNPMIWVAVAGGLAILLWPVSVIVAYVSGYKQGQMDEQKQHAHEQELRKKSMRDRTVTSSSSDEDGRAVVRQVRLRRK